MKKKYKIAILIVLTLAAGIVFTNSVLFNKVDMPLPPIDTAVMQIKPVEIEKEYVQNIPYLFRQSGDQDFYYILTNIVITESRRYNFTPEFIYAVIATESDFYEEANSSKGALFGRGLMQVSEIALEQYNRDRYTYRYEINELYDPYINVVVGCWYLDWLRKQFIHDKIQFNEATLYIAYNTGYGAYKQHRVAYENLRFENTPGFGGYIRFLKKSEEVREFTNIDEKNKVYFAILYQKEY